MRPAGRGFRALAAALWLAAVGWSHAQNVDFLSDLNGNLQAQFAAAAAPPQILRPPQTQIVAPGDWASFAVTVADPTGASYQWYFNNALVPAATRDSLLLTNAAATNEGAYFVVIANSSGSVTSSPAMLYLDSDGDGLPDSWELAHFGNLNQTATGDFDHDGVSNYQEFVDGTDPASTNSVLYQLTVLSDGGQITIAPSKNGYTNGESVTLTATNYFAYDLFRGWTGDTNTFSPAVTLVMTGNKSVFAHFGAYDITWTNAVSGVWTAATNWSPNFVPTTNDNVFISGNVTVTLNGYAECGGLTLGASGSPTLSGSGTLLVHSRLEWSGGFMSGGGTTIVAPGASLAIDSSSSVTLNSRVLQNAGTGLWTGGPILLGNGSVLTNCPGAVLEAQTSAGLPFGLGGANRFDNAGTFLKTTSPGTLPTGSCSFNNYGAVELQSGTLQVVTGGLNTGAMSVTAGAMLDLYGGTFTATPTASLTGTGDLRVSGGTANLDGLVNLTGTHSYVGGTANLIGSYICTNNILSITFGTANFNGNSVVSPATLNLSNGNLGGTNPVTVLTQFNWSGGAMIGGGKTLVVPGATLNINSSSSVSLNPRLLENAGSALWTGAGPILLGSGSVLTNRPGAVFEAQTAAGMPVYLGGANRFDNAGLFRKTISAGTLNTSGGTFNNYNTVELQSGTLQVGAGGLNAATLTVAAGALLDLSGGTFTATPAASLTGAGNLQVSGGTATLDGLVNLTGTHTYVGGTANLIGVYICTNNTLSIPGGTANFNGSSVVSPATLNLGNGNLGGTNLVTVLAQFNWTGGTLFGGGRTVVAPGATLTINSPSGVNLNPRILENAGAALWTGPGQILFGGGSVFTNRPGAVFEAQSVAGWPFYLGGANRFDNAGLFRKTTSSAALNVTGCSFNNYGTLDIETGILALNSGYACTASSVLASAIGGANAGTDYGQLQVGGTVTLVGSLAISITNNYVPALNTAFTIVSAGTRSGAFASFSYPSNTYAFQLSNAPSAVVLTLTNYAGAPVVSPLPPSGVFYAGRTILLTPSAGGAPPVTYQWKRNGTNLADGGRISGAHTSTLAVSNAAFADAAGYQLFLTNSQGYGQSSVEAVGVQAVPKFNTNGAGWSLQGTTPPLMDTGTATLTSGLGGTGRSVFYNAPLYIAAFSAAFLYMDVGGNGADGITFCVQNDARGASALGGAGGGLGYYGITPSVALAFNIYSGNTRGLALQVNSSNPVYVSTTPVNLASGNPIYVSLLYSNGLLKATLVESNTANVYSSSYAVDLPSVLGGQTAYVGFTGGDGGVASTQVISNFTFVPLTGIAVDKTLPALPALWWPGTIGGYSLQSRSNLASAVDLWQNATNPIVLTNSRNQVTLPPAPGNRFYRLSISLDQ